MERDGEGWESRGWGKGEGGMEKVVVYDTNDKNKPSLGNHKYMIENIEQAAEAAASAASGA